MLYALGKLHHRNLNFPRVRLETRDGKGRVSYIEPRSRSQSVKLPKRMQTMRSAVHDEPLESACGENGQLDIEMPSWAAVLVGLVRLVLEIAGLAALGIGAWLIVRRLR